MVGTTIPIVQMKTLSHKMVKNLPKVTQTERMELGWDPGTCRLDHCTAQPGKGRPGVSLELGW